MSYDAKPAFSPAGTKIAFEHVARGSGRIWVKNLENGQITQVTKFGSRITSQDPAWSPDGTKIVFERYSPCYGPDQGPGDCYCSISDIYVTNADGTGQEQNLTNTTQVKDEEPTWSPDGTRIAYSIYDYGTQQEDVWTMNSDGTNQSKLTESTQTLESWPAWSPNGRKIAYEKRLPKAYEKDIWVINADGTNPKNITNTPTFVEEQPSWKARPVATQ